MFGCIDLLAVHPTHGTLGIQTTSGSNVSARVKKCMAEPRMEIWKQAGNKLEVHGWRQIKVKRGGKARKWDCRIVTGKHITPASSLYA